MDEQELSRFREGLARRSPRQSIVDRALRVFVRSAMRLLGWRLDVSGLERIPATGGMLVVGAPHRAWVDPFLLIAAWPAGAPRLSWFGDGPTMVRSWWRRWLFPRLGMIPITPGAGGPRAYAALAAEVTGRGGALALFAEKGPPSSPLETRTIAPGFAYMALAAGVPVVPFAVAGTHHIVRGSWFSLDVLPPMDLGGPLADAFTPEGRGAADAAAAEMRRAVTERLAVRTPWTDARRPARDRWRWLATAFH
jgi:1-acyl-sn-glycerol-3-phosphate acyltransferase